MPKVKLPVPDLLKWLKSAKHYEADTLFREHGTSLAYVRQIAYGFKTPSAEKAVMIEKATGVSRKKLRLDWRQIWPEMK